MQMTSTPICAFLVVAAVLAAAPIVAHAEREQLPVRPIRIEGYWNRTSSAPKVLQGVTFTDSKGGSPRTFGITALQAYKPEEEGVQVLRHSTMAPSIRLLGSEDLVRKFMDAPEQQRVVAFGVYNPGSNTITLNSVQIG